MANTLLRDVDDELLGAYRAAAQASGQSLNAALKEGLKRGRPRVRLSKEQLVALSRSLIAASPITGDSTPYIRWTRDTDGGRYLGGRDDDDRY